VIGPLRPIHFSGKRACNICRHVPRILILDFFVWGHIKNLIERRRDGTEDKVREAILAASNTITPEMAHNGATRNIVRRAELCENCEKMC